MTSSCFKIQIKSIEINSNLFYIVFGENNISDVEKYSSIKTPNSEYDTRNWNAIEKQLLFLCNNEKMKSTTSKFR